MGKFVIPREYRGKGINLAIHRFIYRILYDHKPGKNDPEDLDAFGMIIFLILYTFALTCKKIIIPFYRKFITFITGYSIFSSLYRDSFSHARNVKAGEIMFELEKMACDAEILVFINNGAQGRYYSQYFGEFTKRVIDKEKYLKQMQNLFQIKYPSTFVVDTQGKKTQFRIRIPTEYIK